MKEQLSIHIEVVEADDGHADGVAPIGFAVEGICLIPKAAEIGPEEGTEESGDDGDADPDGLGKSEPIGGWSGGRGIDGSVGAAAVGVEIDGLRTAHRTPIGYALARASGTRAKRISLPFPRRIGGRGVHRQGKKRRTHTPFVRAASCGVKPFPTSLPCNP